MSSTPECSGSSPDRSVRLLTVVLLTAAWGCGPAETEDTGTASEIDESAALLDPTAPVWTTEAPDSFDVEFDTTKGEIRIRVVRAWAPIGVDRFYNLVRLGYFDDSRFFRVVEGFIAQFGIAGDPAVARAWERQEIPDDSVVASNLEGFIAYAMTGPDTRTTQLYISLQDNARLDEQGFSPIGRVIDGMDRVHALYAGYGEDSGGGMRRGEQDSVFASGNAYLDRDFPLLDRILQAHVVDPEAR